MIYILPDNITTSPVDTIADLGYYSNYRQGSEFDGYNGVLFALRGGLSESGPD